MKKNRFIAIVLGAVIAASSITSLTVGAANTNAGDFPDMPDDWSTPALTAAVENGLLSGSDGMLLPKNNLKRSEMAAIIVRAFGASSKASLDSFTDVPADQWYYEHMQKAVAMGVFKGDGSGLLNPGNNITREEVFAVLARAFKLSDGNFSVLDDFSDNGSVSTWARGTTSALVENGYVNGSDGKLNPKAYITRAEFAQIMYNMVKTYIDEPQVLSGEYKGNVIIRISDVTVSKNAKISGTLIICEDCKNIVIEDPSKITRIIDNRSDSGSQDDKNDNENKNDDIFWVIDSGSDKKDDTEKEPGIGSDNSEDGWSGIYRP